MNEGFTPNIRGKKCLKRVNKKSFSNGLTDSPVVSNKGEEHNAGAVPMTRGHRSERALDAAVPHQGPGTPEVSAVRGCGARNRRLPIVRRQRNVAPGSRCRSRP